MVWTVMGSVLVILCSCASLLEQKFIYNGGDSRVRDCVAVVCGSEQEKKWMDPPMFYVFPCFPVADDARDRVHGSLLSSRYVHSTKSAVVTASRDPIAKVGITHVRNC
jgi:hypothetical protein